MATKTAKKAIVEPVINEKLYQIMSQVYQEYTGQQVADVVAKIRREIEAQKEADALDAEVSRLLARRQEIEQID